MLMFPLGAQSIKCSVCHCVTPAPPGGAGPLGGPGGGPARPGGGGYPQQQQHHHPAAHGGGAGQTVVIENPAAMDEQGNEVPQIAVGVKDR